MLSIKTCAAAILFAAVGMSSASATTLNVSVGEDFGNFANSYYTVDATFVLPVGFSNAVLNTSLFAADDRAVLQLNGSNVSETGILGQGRGRFTSCLMAATMPHTTFATATAPLRSIRSRGPLS